MAFALFFYAVNNLKLGLVYFAFYASTTIVGYAIGRYMFSEMLNRLKWLSLILVITGLVLIYGLGATKSNNFYLLFSLGSGLFTAFWNTLVKLIPEKIDNLQIGFLDNLLGLFFILAISIFVGEKWSAPGLSISWISNYALALVLVAAELLINYGFRKIEAQLGSLILLAEIIFSIVLGYIFYREAVSLNTLIGGTLILTGIITPEIYLFKQKKPVKP